MSAPLVLADRRTVSKRDVIEADQVMDDKVTKTAFLYYRSTQKWYWLERHRPEEAVIFTTWTAETDIDHAGKSHEVTNVHN